MTDVELANKLIGRWSDRTGQIIKRNLDLLLNVIRGEVQKIKVDGRTEERNSILAGPAGHEYRRAATEHIIAGQVEIRGVEEVGTKQVLVERAALRLKAKKLSGIEDFRIELAKAASVYLARPMQQYEIVIPLNARPPQSARRQRMVRVFDRRLRKVTWSQVERRYDLQRWFGEFPDLAPFVDRDFKVILRHQPFVLLSWGRDAEDAVANATDAFEFWRSVLNMLDNAGVFSQVFGGPPRPFGRFRPPLSVGVFDSSGKFVTFYYSAETQFSEWPEEISHDLWAGAQRQIDLLHQPRTETDVMSIIIEAHKKIGAALDSQDWRLAFLELWQCLEVMTCRDRSGLFRMEDVRDRAKRLLCEQQPQMDLLLAAYETRNKLVHRGRFSDEGRLEVSMLHSVVEYCLDVLLAVYKICPTWHDLELFYNHAGYTRPELTTTRRITKWLDKMKSQIEVMNGAPNTAPVAGA